MSLSSASTSRGSGSSSSAASSAYYDDPSLTTIARYAQAMLGLPPTRGTAPPPLQAALGAFLHLANVTTMRVVFHGDSPVFGCPVCLFTTRDWSEMNEHRLTQQHAIATCVVCGGVNQHTDRYCVGGFDAPYWVKEDFVIPRAEFLLPSTPQFKCPLCPLVFTTSALLGQHLMGAHRGEFPASWVNNGRANLRMVTSLPRRRFTTPLLLRSPSPVVAPDNKVKRQGRLLYQCTDCLYIFSSWSQWEGHLRATKHTQAYCLDCNKTLGKFVSEHNSHRTATGHSRIVGEQPSKETHLRLVDASDRRHDAALDSPAANLIHPGNMPLLAWQCPAADCCRLFLTDVELHRHVAETGHGRLVCDHCHEEVSAVAERGSWRSIAGHPHAIPNLSSEYWYLRDSSESLQVDTTEATLLTYFPDHFRRCSTCTAVISVDDSRHEGSDVCQATYGRRVALWEVFNHKTRPRQQAAAAAAAAAAATVGAGSAGGGSAGGGGPSAAVGLLPPTANSRRGGTLPPAANTTTTTTTTLSASSSSPPPSSSGVLLVAAPTPVYEFRHHTPM